MQKLLKKNFKTQTMNNILNIIKTYTINFWNKNSIKLKSLIKMCIFTLVFLVLIKIIWVNQQILLAYDLEYKKFLTNFLYNSNYSNKFNLVDYSNELTCKQATAALAIAKSTMKSSVASENAFIATNIFFANQEILTNNYVNNFVEKNCLDVLVEVYNENFLTKTIEISNPGIKAVAVGTAAAVAESFFNESYVPQKIHSIKKIIFKKINLLIKSNKFLSKFFDTNLFLDNFLTFKNVSLSTTNSITLVSQLDKLKEIEQLSKDIMDIEKKSFDYYELRKNFELNSKEYNSILLTTAEVRALAIPLIKKVYILWVETGNVQYTASLLKQELHIRKFCEEIFFKCNNLSLSNNPKSVSNYLKACQYKLENYETIKEHNLRVKK